MTVSVDVKKTISKNFVLDKSLVFPSISVLIAAFNEEEGIGPTICEIKKELEAAQIVVVDGNSTDRTIDIAKDLGAKIFFQRKQGKGDAISEGLKFINKNSKYVIFTDADFTYPAKHIQEMISILDCNPEVGMVLGNRFSQTYKEESDRNQFYMGNRLLGFVHWLFNGVNLNDPFTGLRIIRYELLKNWRPKSLGFDIEAEINYHVNNSEYSIVEVPIKYRKRLGQKKLGFRHGLNIFKRIIQQDL